MVTLCVFVCREFGLVLMYVYIVFMVFSVLIETKTLNIRL